MGVTAADLPSERLSGDGINGIPGALRHSEDRLRFVHTRHGQTGRRMSRAKR